MFCLHVFMCIICVPGALEGQKKVSDPVKLQLQAVVHMQTGHNLMEDKSGFILQLPH